MSYSYGTCVLWHGGEVERRLGGEVDLRLLVRALSQVMLTLRFQSWQLCNCFHCFLWNDVRCNSPRESTGRPAMNCGLQCVSCNSPSYLTLCGEILVLTCANIWPRLQITILLQCKLPFSNLKNVQGSPDWLDCLEYLWIFVLCQHGRWLSPAQLSKALKITIFIVCLMVVHLAHVRLQIQNPPFQLSLRGILREFSRTFPKSINALSSSTFQNNWCLHPHFPVWHASGQPAQFGAARAAGIYGFSWGARARHSASDEAVWIHMQIVSNLLAGSFLSDVVEATNGTAASGQFRAHWFGEGASRRCVGNRIGKTLPDNTFRLNSVGRNSGDSRDAVHGGCRCCFAHRVLESQEAEALPWYLAFGTWIERFRWSHSRVHMVPCSPSEASKFEAFNVANGYSRPSSEASLSASIRRSWLAAPKKQDGVRAYQIAPIHGGMCHPPQSEAVRRDLLEHLVWALQRFQMISGSIIVYDV